MNARRAKRLRRTAKSLTHGQPNVEYEPLTPSWVFSPANLLRAVKRALFTGQVRLAQRCTRALYQHMKSPRYQELF